MSSYIVDRRLNSKNKSTVNRQRFLKRYRKQIRKAVADAVNKRKLEDMEKGDNISIPKKDLSEPVFSHGPGGKQSIVHPGNKKFIAGDKFKRPEGGQGGPGDGQASDSGEGEDEFIFQISQAEFLEFMFEDLALPNMVKMQLSSDDSFRYKRAGISEVGSPNQINVVRSLRSAHARRIALGGKKRKLRRQLQAELDAFLETTDKPYNDAQQKKKQLLEEEIANLSRRLNALPYIDDFDLKYNLRVKIPQPSPKAVMFCVLDVSGSMTQEIKDTAKRFFYLLYLFLQRTYKKIEVVFIRHHTQAKEVDEEEFFYARETGGTVVSSALDLMGEIIRERYSPEQWNIYGAQASDGDNWQNDNVNCREAMEQSILPNVQYFTYIEIGEQEPQELWHLYAELKVKFHDRFAMNKVRNNGEIFPVFRELFKKRSAMV